MKKKLLLGIVCALGSTIYSYTPVYKGDGGYRILNWN